MPTLRCPVPLLDLIVVMIWLFLLGVSRVANLQQVTNRKTQVTAYRAARFSCDAHCDVTLSNSGVRCLITAIDSGPSERRKSLFRRIFIAVRPRRVNCLVPSVNRRVAGSSPARGAKFPRSIPETWVTPYSGDMGNSFEPN